MSSDSSRAKQKQERVRGSRLFFPTSHACERAKLKATTCLVAERKRSCRGGGRNICSPLPLILILHNSSSSLARFLFLFVQAKAEWRWRLMTSSPPIHANLFLSILAGQRGGVDACVISLGPHSTVLVSLGLGFKSLVSTTSDYSILGLLI